jgi:hypothetical protein
MKVTQPSTRYILVELFQGYNADMSNLMHFDMTTVVTEQGDTTSTPAHGSTMSEPYYYIENAVFRRALP